jgi:hypothetical protein
MSAAQKTFVEKYDDSRAAFANDAGLVLVPDQSLIHAIYPRLPGADNAALWRELLENSVLLTVARYGDCGQFEVDLLRANLWFRHIPSRLGPYPNRDTTQYLIVLPHAGSALDIAWKRLMAS